MKTSFDPVKHEYLIDGKRATGVTTVIGVLAKPALIGWAARMVVEHIKSVGFHRDAQLPPVFDSGEESWEVTASQLAEAQVAHTKKKEAAGQIGTDSHALVEEYINLCIEAKGIILNVPVTFPRFTPIVKFAEWAYENVEQFLFSERQMFNKDMFVAGTADFGCVLKTGQKLIGDFKTSSGVYGIDYYLQCAGYKILAEAEGDKKYDGCVIVRLGKKGPKDFDVTYNYDTETAEKSFMACLTLYRAQAALKQTAVKE